MKSHIVQIKLWKSPHNYKNKNDEEKLLESPSAIKISGRFLFDGVSFRSKNRLFCYETLYIFTYLFVHTFFPLTMTPALLWKGPHIYIPSVIFVISLMLINVFNSPKFFVNITVIPIYFYCFIFYFEFYYRIVDISVNHHYVHFLRSVVIGETVVTKNEKKNKK